MSNMRVLGLSTGVLLGLLLVPVPAHANDHTSGSGNAHLGAGDSYQFVSWNRTTRKVRLVVALHSSADSDKCFDASFDWRVSNAHHYDARVVRNCKPGGYVETDPVVDGGDGYWNEPSDWDTRPVDGVNRAYGVKIDDDTLAVELTEKLFGVQNDPYGDQYGNDAPPTSGQWNVAIRTLYQSGQIVSRRLEVNPPRCSQNTDSCSTG